MTVVAVEVLALAVLAATGWLLAPSDRGEPWRLVVALPLGIAAHACVELVLLVTRLPIAHPWVAAVLALVVALVVARLRDRTPEGAPAAVRRWSGRPMAVAATVAAFVVLVTAAVPVVNVTSDTFRYLTISRLLVVDADASRMSAFLLQSRSLAVGTLHGLALPDLGYLRAVGPLVAASTLGALWLLVREGLVQLDPRTARWVAAAAAVLVATNHRFLFHAFYVNGHLLFAAWLLLLVAVAWRRVLAVDQTAAAGGTATRDGSAAVWSGDALVAGLLAVGLTVLRPEGALVAALALTPVVLEPTVPRRWRQLVLVVFGAGNLVWHLGVVSPLRDTPHASLVGMAVLGAATVLAAGLLPVVDRWHIDRGRLLVALHLLVWGVVGVMAMRDASILVGTVKSIGRNVLDQGGWGISLLVLAGVLAIALAAERVAGERALLFPLLTFAPLAVLLNHARGGPGRVGPGDSLNRMLVHLLPLAVLVLALVADGRRRRADDRRPGAEQAVDAG